MQKPSSTGIPLEFTNLKKYQFSGSWCMYTPNIHHAWVSKTVSLRPTIAVAFLHLRKRTLRALYFMVRLSLVDPNLVSPVRTPPWKVAWVFLELLMHLGALWTTNSSQNCSSWPAAGVSFWLATNPISNSEEGGAPFPTHVPSRLTGSGAVGRSQGPQARPVSTAIILIENK